MLLTTFTKTTDTTDPAAIEINQISNEVLRAYAIGKVLKRVLDEECKGNISEFKRWIIRHLDVSPQSAKRYLAVYEHGTVFVEHGGIRLLEVYGALHLEGKPNDLEKTI